MVRRSTLRASDAEREQVAERLRNATAEGRLAPEELEHRLAAALRAQTYGDLERTVGDLPVPRDSRGSRSIPRWALGTVRAHPMTLFIIVPVLAVIAAIVLAVTVITMVLMVAVLVLTHGRYRPPLRYARRSSLTAGNRHRYPARRRRPASHFWA